MIREKDINEAIGTAIELADNRSSLIRQREDRDKAEETRLELASKILNLIRRDMPKSFTEHLLTELTGDIEFDDSPVELTYLEEKLIHDFPDPNDWNGRTYEDEEEEPDPVG